MVVNTIQELIDLLNLVDTDATVLAAIANDSPTSTENGPSAGLVTTRLGTNVKNVQKVIADIESGVITGVRPSIQEEGVTVLESPGSFNFIGTNVTVTADGTTADITVEGEVSVDGTPADNQIGVWTGENTIEGSSNLTFNGALLSLNADATPTLTINDTNDSATLAANIFNIGTPIAAMGTTTNHPLQLNTNNLPRIYITEDGDIGIGGITTPEDQIHIRATDPAIRIENTSSGLGYATITSFGFNSGLSFNADPLDEDDNTDIRFIIDGVERFRVDANGMSTNIGADTFTYEEGTFTPVLADDPTAGNVATTLASIGNYTRIGNTVHCFITLTNVDTTGLTGGNTVYIRDLPFASVSSNNQYSGAAIIDNIAFTDPPIARLNASQDYLRLAILRSGLGATHVTVADLTSGTADIRITLTYRI